MGLIKAILTFFGVVIALVVVGYIIIGVAFLLPFIFIIIIALFVAAIVKHDHQTKKQKRSD
jgi:fatty acid desaturase